ncbi:hypothetical protein A5482_011865 [Cyanobacterium sp. IPPAS B-1200]|uniref:hypothetical protein n=1 Tax=Cyanobacterium sp. IPPAS B-1200 TaxID=1562720 RepID=UPI000852585F|nr:hypothetical protein [Cyanobacterium sp. IPPAS B-1200]OEJ77368.1 hypothetical protein A5482_06625 [Cyanobacterium sp. IPPAS B-1200]
MDSSQQINEALNQKDYKQALLIALSNSLKITLKTSLKTKDNTYAIAKEIDLVKGSATNIDSELLDYSHENIVNFHQQKTAEIYQTWEQNRETLLKAFDIMAGGNLNLEPLQFSTNSSLEEEDLSQEYISDIPENFEDFTTSNEEDSSIISEAEFENFTTDNEQDNQSISEAKFDDFAADNQSISEKEFDAFDAPDDIEEDEFTQIISPDEVAESSYDDFDGSFGEDTSEESWVDDVVIQDYEETETVGDEVLNHHYVTTEEDESEALFDGTDFDALGETDSAEGGDEEEADWGDLLEDSQTNASAEEATPAPEEDDIDDWNEWIESQDGGEISCNPQEIDWSEDDWSDTPA